MYGEVWDKILLPTGMVTCNFSDRSTQSVPTITVVLWTRLCVARILRRGTSYQRSWHSNQWMFCVITHFSLMVVSNGIENNILLNTRDNHSVRTWKRNHRKQNCDMSQHLLIIRLFSPLRHTDGVSRKLYPWIGNKFLRMKLAECVQP